MSFSSMRDIVKRDRLDAAQEVLRLQRHQTPAAQDVPFAGVGNAPRPRHHPARLRCNGGPATQRFLQLFNRPVVSAVENKIPSPLPQVSTAIGLATPSGRESKGWLEGAAIWAAVLIVVSVGAGNDYQKDRQFRKLYKQRDVICTTVIRDGQQTVVPSTHVVVGDVLLLDSGDKVVADCFVVESFGLVVDESSLTGETRPIKKDNAKDPWVRWASVTEGLPPSLPSAHRPALSLESGRALRSPRARPGRWCSPSARAPSGAACSPRCRRRGTSRRRCRSV